MSGTALLAAVTAASVIAGCGNSGDDETSRTRRPRRQPTRAEFAAGSKRICDDLGHRAETFIPLGTDPTTRRNSRLGIIHVYLEAGQQLRALGYPRGARAALEAWYRDIEASANRAANAESIDLEKAIGDALARHRDTIEKYAPGCR